MDGERDVITLSPSLVRGVTALGRVAALLEALADGATVELGDFSDNASPATDADDEALVLRELATGIRSRS